MKKPTYEQLLERIQELEEQKRQFDNLTENIAMGIFRTTPGLDGSFIKVNPAFVKMLGYGSKKELQEKKIEDIYFNPASRTTYLDKIIRLSFVENEELIYKRKDGSPVIISETAIAVKNSDNEVIYIEGFAENISSKKRADQELQLQKTFYKQLFNSAPEAIILHDVNDIVTDINEEFTRMFGYTREEVIGKPTNQIVAPDVYQENAAFLSGKVTKGQSVKHETKRRHKDGTLFDVSILGAPIFHGDEQLGIFAIYRDITDQKRAEAQIRNDLKEKEILLKEIHHRVKNNLNVITSLLGLQSRRITSKEQAMEAFQESRERIFSMALVHERLYMTTNFSSVDMNDYINSISRKLISAYTIAGQIQVKIEVENALLDMNTAIPCGLILNELITNSLKHAFPNGEKGILEIKFKKMPDDGFQLILSDNGIGMKTPIDAVARESLGMEIVTILVSQIGGDLKIDINNGTTFQLNIPRPGSD